MLLCNNIIIGILKCADSQHWSNEKINIKEKDSKAFKTNKHDLFYWREHGYATAINRSLYKHIFFSLVSDYNIYIYNALNCASRYQFGPAFSLLRKPFKDDLLLLEMLYIKGPRFVSEFLKKPIENFAIDQIAKNTKNTKSILRKTCKKIEFFKGQKMYNLRYSKKSKESLEKIWNKASHIITTHKDYKTSDGNLNIVFASEKEVEEHIVYFYKVCCSIQLYFINLVLNFLLEENLITKEIYNENITNIFFAFSCTLDDEITDEQEKALLIKCNHCGDINKMTKKIIKMNHINEVFEFKCAKCNKITKIEGFVTQ